MGRALEGIPRNSSTDEEMGEDNAGEERMVSSMSEPEIGPASRDAAKLLEISGSETTA